MINLWPPLPYQLHPLLIFSGRNLRVDSSGDGATGTGHTTLREIGVTVMIIQPTLEQQQVFRCCQRYCTIMIQPIKHGVVPLLVEMHPAIIILTLRRPVDITTVKCGKPVPVIVNRVGNTVGDCHLGFAGILFGQQPGEVRWIAVLHWIPGQIAEAIQLVGKHVADTGGGATGTARL